ncbi:MAG: hypothetical protein MZV63_12470 [Marinilabiliales bacterium]|nr:hypothetical protein [Marinilabiliales bacterium]
MREVVRSIAVIPDQITRTVYVKECSMQLSMPEEVVLDEVLKLRKQQSFRDRNAWPAQDAMVSSADAGAETAEEEGRDITLLRAGAPASPHTLRLRGAVARHRQGDGHGDHHHRGRLYHLADNGG